MIAEYERAQILERSRRGKRHRAQQGQVNVLSGAPFGYRYMRKTDQSAAYYEVVVRHSIKLRSMEPLALFAHAGQGGFSNFRPLTAFEAAQRREFTWRANG